jgi:hypothetical protein
MVFKEDIVFKGDCSMFSDCSLVYSLASVQWKYGDLRGFDGSSKVCNGVYIMVFTGDIVWCNEQTWWFYDVLWYIMISWPHS